MKNIKVRNKIKEYCKERNITLRQLAEISGVSAQSLYQRKDHTITNVCKIMAALDCKFEDLFEIIEQ